MLSPAFRDVAPRHFNLKSCPGKARAGQQCRYQCWQSHPPAGCLLQTQIQALEHLAGLQAELQAGKALDGRWLQCLVRSAQLVCASLWLESDCMLGVARMASLKGFPSKKASPGAAYWISEEWWLIPWTVTVHQQMIVFMCVACHCSCSQKVLYISASA